MDTDIKELETGSNELETDCREFEIGGNIADAGGDVTEMDSAGNKLDTAGNKEGSEVTREVDEVEKGKPGNEEAPGELGDRTIKGILGISMILISSIVSKLVPPARISGEHNSEGGKLSLVSPSFSKCSTLPEDSISSPTGGNELKTCGSE